MAGWTAEMLRLLLSTLTPLTGVPGLSEPLRLFLESVLLLNLWLGGFNLIPTLPLDGGRALRGFIWHRTDDFRRATRVATFFSRALAALIFVASAALFVASLDERTRPFSSLLGYDPRMVGIAGILVAWFMNSGARSAYRQMILQSRFEGLSVQHLMTPEPQSVTPWTSIEEVVSKHFLQRGERAVAVAREGGMLAGLVAYADTKKVPRAEWAKRTAAEVMTPLPDLVTVGPDDGVDVAIRHMAEGHFNQLPVVANGRLVGSIARVNILRYLDVKDDDAKPRP